MLQTEQNPTDSAAAHAAREAAQALARKVADSAIYKEFEAAATAFREDAEAQKRFRAYQNAQRETQMMQSWSGSDGASVYRFRRVEKDLVTHPTYKRYLAAQEDMLIELRDLNAYLAEKLGFDFADLTKPAGGCC